MMHQRRAVKVRVREKVLRKRYHTHPREIMKTYLGRLSDVHLRTVTL